jgi:preprotein translocase subunit SecG
MLPFMRDENNSGPKPLGGQGFLEKSPAHKPLRDGTASADRSSDNKQQDAQPAAGGAGQNRVANPAAKVRMALEAPGQVQEQPEYLTVAGRGRAVRKTTYMLVGLFIVGLVCLWFMVRKSTPRQAGAAGREDTQIEQAISRLTGVSSEMFDRMDEIVGKFYEFSEVQQVKVNELAKNPFRHDMFVGDLQALRMRESSDERARQTAADMQLLSIIESELGNCCMIDDRVLYEGDSIRGFRVREIRKTSVKLQSEESEIELKLSE